MPKNTIPAYAIVELLMRLVHINNSIGDYRGHDVRDDRVSVKTSGGNITFPQTLIMQQFQDPEQIGHTDLEQAALLFKPHVKGKNHLKV